MTDSVAQTAPPPTPESSPLPLRKELEQRFQQCELLRGFCRQRYDAGEVLEYDVTGVVPANSGRMTVEVEKFVGGGFAGQVYRVVLRELTTTDGPIEGLTVGQTYAIKILKPPSGFSCVFRDFLYFLAYQAPFSAQVNPEAMRVGVLWQKLIRRAAVRALDSDNAVCDTFATFFDAELHSFGEINEWVPGRIWQFEVDDRLFERTGFDERPPENINSAEYVHKKVFMRELVALLHEMGAPELARQYEWWTCKSQPNALKRLDADDSPRAGLTAIDFRAGLALMPCLPMSPADLWLIPRGVFRGRIMQFDRSDPRRFEQYIADHRDEFTGLEPAIDELRERERRYRRSMPDVTHHHVRLLIDGQLRKSIKSAAITGWHNLGKIDDEHADRLHAGRGPFALLYLLTFIPLLGNIILKLWGSARRRAHVWKALTSFGYMWRAMRGARIEVLIGWHRQDRVTDERARKLVDRPFRYWTQRILVSWMPVTWHRAFTESGYAWALIQDKIRFISKFLWDPRFREEWLLTQVELGRQEGMLTRAEAETIVAQVKDPYIQKYLRCLAVHICTVPVTQVVMILVGGAVATYMIVVQKAAWHQAMIAASAAAAVVQLSPISPGSLARGLFVLYLMIRERDVKNYYIAAPVAFIHVIGYLAFPLQMVAHDPALARFMAARWAKSAVHIVPVFGESGGLLEHGVFDLFFNLPLSFRRRFHEKPVSTVLVLAAMAAMLGYPTYRALSMVYDIVKHLLML
ncbi:MAG: hypothetical protein JXO22_00300 [Phycisphaerae bacterium]|nr:hypothetical protein [Phycisphaerae bacterium]